MLPPLNIPRSNRSSMSNQSNSSFQKSDLSFENVPTMLDVYTENLLKAHGQKHLAIQQTHERRKSEALSARMDDPSDETKSEMKKIRKSLSTCQPNDTNVFQLTNQLNLPELRISRISSRTSSRPSSCASEFFQQYVPKVYDCELEDINVPELSMNIKGEIVGLEQMEMQLEHIDRQISAAESQMKKLVKLQAEMKNHIQKILEKEELQRSMVKRQNNYDSIKNQVVLIRK